MDNLFTNTGSTAGALGLVSGFPNLCTCGGGFAFQLGANYAHGIDVQAGHVLMISEPSRCGIQSANVSHKAEEQWISDQLDTRISGFVLGVPDTAHRAITTKKAPVSDIGTFDVRHTAKESVCT